MPSLDAPQSGLRNWLDRLARTDRLTVTRSGLGLKHGLAAIANRLDGRTATLFPHPDGHAGSVVSGLVSSRAWMAEAFGVTEDRLIAHVQAASAAPLPVRTVSNAPAQTIVHRDNIDLNALLPIPTLNEYDSGPYISAGLMIARDPDTGGQNVAILRCQINSADRIGVLVLAAPYRSFLSARRSAGTRPRRRARYRRRPGLSAGLAGDRAARP